LFKVVVSTLSSPWADLIRPWRRECTNEFWGFSRFHPKWIRSCYKRYKSIWKYSWL